MKRLFTISLYFIVITATLIVAAHGNTYGFFDAANAANSDSASLSEQEKKKLKEDAQKLSEDFRALFQDLSKSARAIIGSAIDSTADWITENYAELSEKNREKLQEMLESMRENLKDLREMSVESLRNALKELKELMEHLEQEIPSPQEKEGDAEGVHI